MKNMELEDLKRTWKSVGPHIEKVSAIDLENSPMKQKTDVKTRLLRRFIASFTVSAVCVILTLTSRLWAPMLFPMSWLIAFGICGCTGAMAELYLIIMIRKINLWESSVSEVMNATIRLKRYYKNLELIFSIIFVILIGWIMFMPPFFNTWRMALVWGALIAAMLIELRLYRRNISLINRLSES